MKIQILLLAVCSLSFSAMTPVYALMQKDKADECSVDKDCHRCLDSKVLDVQECKFYPSLKRKVCAHVSNFICPTPMQPFVRCMSDSDGKNASCAIPRKS